MPYISRGRREFPVVSRYNLGRAKRAKILLDPVEDSRAREDNVRIRGGGGRRRRRGGGGRRVGGGHKKGSREWQERNRKETRYTL